MTFDLLAFPNMSLNVMGKTSPSIEEFLNNSRHALTNLQEIKRKGVFAVRNLLCDTKTKAFDIKELIENSKENVEDKIFIDTDQKGNLHAVSNEINWIGAINLSPDIHSSNINLEINSITNASDSWTLRITKNVNAGNELQLWFSEDVLALIDMPFLTPKNIAGHKRYHCHMCEETFEYPNPLKIHLLLSCGKYSLIQLWIKLEKALNRKKSEEMTQKSHKSIIAFQRCISEPPRSAFSPYKKYSEDFHLQTELRECNEPLNLTMPVCPIDNQLNGWGGLELRLSHSLEELSGNYAADVELFASNWGKTKQGHLCVYCGKVYSRKYGLKIHIRTHTGYKPLKCKFCLRPFGDPSNLNKHVRLHASSLTPYICNLCGKIMVRRRDLDRHLKSYHSGNIDSLSPKSKEEI